MKSDEKVELKRLRRFVRFATTLSELPPTRKHRDLVVDEYPFDSQLLRLSRIYRVSRQLFLANGGRFSPTIYSLQRSVSGQDLFSNVLEYAPTFTELLWFKDNHPRLMDPFGEMNALDHFNAIPLFHEQNHRILWQMLPPPAKGEENLKRYLNFAEGLVIALDVALAEELGETSTPFRRIGVIYRTVIKGWLPRTRAERRRYLIAVFYTAYCRLEAVGRSELRATTDRALPNQPAINRRAVVRAREIADFFVEVATPEWLRLHSASSGVKLRAMHRGSTRAPLLLPQDPRDASAELFSCVDSIFEAFLNKA